MTTKTIVLTSGTSWAIPPDAAGSTATVVCFGAGATGQAGFLSCCCGVLNYGAGGASGCVAQKTTFTIPGSGSVSLQIPAGGSGSDCWFSSTGTVLASSGNTSSASCVGDIVRAGNPGGAAIVCPSAGGNGGSSPGVNGSGGPTYTLTAGGTAGPGGGGAGSTSPSSAGGGGGAYGGGGGGGGRALAAGGAGAQGAIVIIYTVVSNVFGTAGLPNYDQPNPRGYVPSVALKYGTTEPSSVFFNLLTVIQNKPFLNSDQPLPNRGSYFNRDIVSYTDPIDLSLLSKDQFFGAAGQPPANLDWPVPKGPQFPMENRGYVRSLTEFYSSQQLYYAPGMGVPQLDWPVPRGYQRDIDLITIDQSNAIFPYISETIYGAPGQGVPNYDWPVPKGYVPEIDLRTLVQNNTLVIFNQETFDLRYNPNYDWPVPKGYIPGISLKTWTLNHTLDLINLDQGEMGTVYDWPNPKGPRWPSDITTIVQHTNLQLLEQQKFFYGNRGPVYDYPNPRAYGQSNTQYSMYLKSILNIRKPTTFALILG